MRNSSRYLALSVAAALLSGCSENGDVGPTSTTPGVTTTAGPLEVVTVTTGSDKDPDRYFLVDGHAWWSMPIGGERQNQGESLPRGRSLSGACRSGGELHGSET